MKKIEDQPFLFGLATSDKDFSVSAAALNKLDEERLQKIVTDTTLSNSIKIDAIKRIKDQPFLMNVKCKIKSPQKMSIMK